MLAPTDFNCPEYRHAHAHSLCMGLCREADPALPYYLGRVSRAGAHLPNLRVCADCRDDVLRACLRQGETVTVFTVCDAGGSLPPAPGVPSPAATAAYVQGDLFAHPDKEIPLP